MSGRAKGKVEVGDVNQQCLRLRGKGCWYGRRATTGMRGEHCWYGRRAPIGMKGEQPLVREGSSESYVETCGLYVKLAFLADHGQPAYFILHTTRGIYSRYQIIL
jgi:hypothetical protein